MLGAFALALGMLIAGSFNTVSNEFMDNVRAKGITGKPSNFWGHEEEEGKPASGMYAAFNHPFVQAEFMFMGEAICLLVFLAKNSRAARPYPCLSFWPRTSEHRELAWSNQHGWKAIFCYAGTASCDMTATSIMYAGLVLSSASIYQMLRGAIIVFTALLSVVWLKKRLMMFHWASIAVVVLGICIVGAESIIQESASGQNGGRILGMSLILAAQAVQSVQVVAQEKLIRKYGTPDLLLVGLEGVFGAVILGLLLIPMYFVNIDGFPIENALDAWVQVKNSPSELPTGHPEWHLPVGNALAVSIAGNIVSIAFFNVFGIKITTVMSGSHRMVLDSLRTCVVWAVALILGWEQFHIMQLVGFTVMLVGTAMYNEFIRIPVLFNYPAHDVDVITMPLKDEQTQQIIEGIVAATGDHHATRGPANSANVGGA